MRKEAQRSQKVTQQTVPKARRLSREVCFHFRFMHLFFFFPLACAYGKTFVHQMLLYWKKYEKVEKEHRKRAEKEAMEQRKLDDEFREVLFIYRNT